MDVSLPGSPVFGVMDGRAPPPFGGVRSNLACKTADPAPTDKLPYFILTPLNLQLRTRSMEKAEL